MIKEKGVLRICREKKHFAHILSWQLQIYQAAKDRYACTLKNRQTKWTRKVIKTRTCITHMNDIPTGSWSKDGQQTPLPTIQILYSPLRLEISFLFCCLRQIPVEAGNEELRRVRENKPSCNQVGEHCSRPITTLLDKSLFSLHTVST